MKLHKFFIPIILILLIPSSGYTTPKIQIGDNWTYIDNTAKLTEYNELSEDVFVFSAIAVSSANTTRNFYIDYSFDFVSPHSDLIDNNVIANLKLSKGDLYLTQVAGIPLSHNRNITGTILLNNTLYQINTTPFIIITGNPTLGISTGEPTTFSILTQFEVSNTSNFKVVTTSFYIEISIEFLLSNLGSEDNIFILQVVQQRAWVIKDNEIFRPTLSALGLQQTLFTALEITLDSNSKLPILIKQTEPVKTASLTLSSTTEVIEYTLQSTEDFEDPLPINFLFGLVTLPILMILRRKR